MQQPTADVSQLRRSSIPPKESRPADPVAQTYRRLCNVLHIALHNATSARANRGPRAPAASIALAFVPTSWPPLRAHDASKPFPLHFPTQSGRLCKWRQEQNTHDRATQVVRALGKEFRRHGFYLSCEQGAGSLLQERLEKQRQCGQHQCQGQLVTSAEFERLNRSLDARKQREVLVVRRGNIPALS